MTLDTGASITTIPIEAGMVIGCDSIKSKRKIKIVTATGIEYAPVVAVLKVKLLDFIGEEVNRNWIVFLIKSRHSFFIFSSFQKATTFLSNSQNAFSRTSTDF